MNRFSGTPRVRHIRFALGCTLAAIAFSARPTLAQTITIDPASMTAASAQGGVERVDASGNRLPYNVATPVPRVQSDSSSTTGKVIGYLTPASWVEIPFTVTTAGLYNASLQYGTKYNNVMLQLDVRPAGTEDHYATVDVPAMNSGTFSVTSGIGISNIPLLQTGAYILRIRNVSYLHNTYSSRYDSYQYDGQGFNNRLLNVGAITLTRTGSLSGVGAINGKVTASDIGGFGVGGAFVMANPAGDTVPEPGPLWQKGFWTVSKADGTYSLKVAAGSYTVQAGRPDTYVYEGVTSDSTVSVSGGGAPVVNLALPSKWAIVDDLDQLKVQSEYFHAKNADDLLPLDEQADYQASAILLTGDYYLDQVTNSTSPNDGNAFKVAFTEPGQFIDIYVDVPVGKAGLYDVTDYYIDGNEASFTRQFIANPGTPDESMIEGTAPGTPQNYTTPLHRMVGTPIRLKEGRNVIREITTAGTADMDYFVLTPHVEVAPGTARPADANLIVALGEASTGFTTTPQLFADGTVGHFYRGSYVEIPFALAEPGIYKATIKTATTLDYGTLQLDVRKAGTDQHYATPDFAVPNTLAWETYEDVVVENIPVLQAGDQVLRVRNTTHWRSTVTDRSLMMPTFNGAFNATGVNFGVIVFEKTGPLPAVGTIAGTVKASDIGNFGVADAYVMANAAGAEVSEPGVLWQKGFWTRTDAGGAYTLPVLAGTYSVQAGRSDTYALAGSAVIPTTVAASQTKSVEIPLPSRWTTGTDGKVSVQIESEYFHNKAADTFGGGAYAASVVVVQGEETAQNGLRAGYIDAGEWIDLHVDVPKGAAGQYILTDKYFNGYWDGASLPTGLVRFTANMGTANESVTEEVEENTSPNPADPNLGYTTPGVKVFQTPITLKEGHNVIRQMLVDRPDELDSNVFDAFVLTSVNVPSPPASAGQVLRILGGLEAGPLAGAEFDAMDAVKDGKLNLLDATSLAKQGKL